MPRAPRVTFSGSIHHVYGRGVDKHQIFVTPQDYQRFLNQLQKLITKHDTSILCWCLMPSHFHLLLRVKKTPLSTFMAKLLTSYAVFHNKKYNRVGPLFQNRFGSKLVQDDPYFLQVARYILLNPVMAGLTHDPFRYPYSSLTELEENSAWKILDKKEVESLMGEGKSAMKMFRQFLHDGLKMDLSEWEPFADSKDIIGSPLYTTRRTRKFAKSTTKEKSSKSKSS